jgi:glycerophosphoryl diester phosphodiesterase
MPAFERARGQGARAIELDVRTCAGSGCVVFHDATLARMTGQRDGRRVEDVPFEELRRIDLGGATVPSLAEVLAWARASDVAVNVELKHDVARRASLARVTMAAVRQAAADVLISSFDPLLLAMAAARAPRVPRALLTHRGQAIWADRIQEAVRPPLVGALHVEKFQAAPPLDLSRYARRGLRLGAWTVNDPEEARALVRAGVASIITDTPGDILACLASPLTRR